MNHRERAAQSQRDLVALMENLRTLLLEYSRFIERSVGLVEAGVGSRDLLGRSSISIEAMTEGFRKVEAARHTVRLHLVALGLDEGLTITEMAQKWGLSRQLISRYAKEARELG